MPRPDRALAARVIARSKGRCEYCGFPEHAAELSFHIDHVIAEKHGGVTEESNLVWACFSCNLHKGPNIAGLDPISGELTRLFHPRQDAWEDHFQWRTSWLHGKTAVGRTTVAVLDINHADMIGVREALAEEMDG